MIEWKRRACFTGKTGVIEAVCRRNDSQPAKPYGGGAVCEGLQVAVRAVPDQIDKDVDPVVSHDMRRGLGIDTVQVCPACAGPHQVLGVHVLTLAACIDEDVERVGVVCVENALEHRGEAAGVQRRPGVTDAQTSVRLGQIAELGWRAGGRKRRAPVGAGIDIR